MLAFQDILGHDSIKQHFQKAIELHKVSHAYILAGEAGMGRKSLAHAFALTLLCEKGGSQPCMNCHACKQVLSGNHPDLIHVTHEKPGSIGVDDIREQINDTIMIRPYSSYYKVYIVDDAEKMTIQAQNALLKTIEEPPSYAVIILLTINEDLFLPTILSRCVQLKLKPLKDSVIQAYLKETMGIPEREAQLYAAFARGNLGKAIKLSDSEEFKDMYKRLLSMLRNIKNMDISQLLDYSKKLKEEMDIYECLDFMQVWYRDALMFKVTNDANLLIFKDEYSTISDMSRHIGYDGFENILQAIEKARIRLEANVNMELAMELMFLVMKEN
ncbi:MAG: DNA polymerase III subunit delta' [Hungatella sp.]|jgi:DNA polymerase-3 subunit delta'|nr:DNA polymerase III subunit delta' [Hungatella sp.]